MNHFSINAGLGSRDYAFASLGIGNVFYHTSSESADLVLSKKIKSKRIECLSSALTNEEFITSQIDIISISIPKPLKKEVENDKEDFYIKNFISIIERKKPKWFIWECEPGFIFSRYGERFKSFIRRINEVGYGLSWRVFDSQFFGSPREDARLYVVGYFGAWEPTREVLFEEGSFIGCLEKKQSSKKNNREGRVEICSKGKELRVSVSLKEKESRLRAMTFKELERCKGLPDNWSYQIRSKDKETEKHYLLTRESSVNVYKHIGKRILFLEKMNEENNK